MVMPKSNFDYQPPRGTPSPGAEDAMYQVALSALWVEIAATRIKSGESVETAVAVADKFVAEYDRRNPTKAKPKFGVKE